MHARRSVPSLTLLIAVALGVLGMHTLGHPRAEGHEPVRQMVAHMAVADPQQSLAALIDSGDQPGMPMNPLVMCLAILCAVSTLLLAALCLRRLRIAAATPRQPLGMLVDAIRGPPRTGVGLLIADLSVLRN